MGLAKHREKTGLESVRRYYWNRFEILIMMVGELNSLKYY